MRDISRQMPNNWANMKMWVAFSWWKLISGLYLSWQRESDCWMTFIFIKIEQTVVFSWCISCWCFCIKQINSKSENRLWKQQQKSFMPLPFLWQSDSKPMPTLASLHLWKSWGKERNQHFPSPLTLLLVLSKFFFCFYVTDMISNTFYYW